MRAITFTSHTVSESAGSFVIPDTPDEISLTHPHSLPYKWLLPTPHHHLSSKFLLSRSSQGHPGPAPCSLAAGGEEL